MAFVNPLRQGFLDEDTSPSLECQQCHMRMPVIGRGDDDTVDVFVVQQSSKLLGCGGPLVLGLLKFGIDFVENRLVNIAEGRDLRSPFFDGA